MKQSKLNHYEKLTPAKHLDQMTTYEDALDFSFNEPDLLNIALTGPYSAGKSSVINSYKEKNQKILCMFPWLILKIPKVKKIQLIMKERFN